MATPPEKCHLHRDYLTPCSRCYKSAQNQQRAQRSAEWLAEHGRWLAQRGRNKQEDRK
jgi:hypothetical protein